MNTEFSSKEATLLFHHHESVYRDANGGLWLSSSLGRWLDEVASRFNRLYILNFEACLKSAKHDYPLQQANVTWVNLGVNKGYRDFFKKRERLNSECRRWSGRADYLLIRGFTPFQNRVWGQIAAKKGKAYFLVRSLKQPREISILSPSTWLGYLRNRLQEYRFGSILKTADYLFTNSKEVEKELGEAGWTVSYSTTNVLKASDAGDVRLCPCGRSRDFRLLFVGRVSELKGVRELMESFIELQKGNPGVRIILDVVGDGLSGFVDEIKGRIGSAGLVDQVCFHGRIPYGEALFAIYRGAHVFVLPSYSEGFPRVVWEAALFGLPIVVSDVGGIPDLFEHRKHALLIKPRDSRALLSALEEVLLDEEGGLQRARLAYDLALNNTLESGVDVLIQGMNN